MTRAITVVLISLGLLSAVAPAAFATGGPPRCVSNCK